MALGKNNPLHYPKGWRAGPQKLAPKVFIPEKSGTYVKKRPITPP